MASKKKPFRWFSLQIHDCDPLVIIAEVKKQILNATTCFITEMKEPLSFLDSWPFIQLLLAENNPSSEELSVIVTQIDSLSLNEKEQDELVGRVFGVFERTLACFRDKNIKESIIDASELFEILFLVQKATGPAKKLGLALLSISRLVNSFNKDMQTISNPCIKRTKSYTSHLNERIPSFFLDKGNERDQKKESARTVFKNSLKHYLERERPSDELVICRICEDSIPISLLHNHTQICAQINNEDLRILEGTEKIKQIMELLELFLNSDQCQNAKESESDNLILICSQLIDSADIAFSSYNLEELKEQAQFLQSVSLSFAHKNVQSFANDLYILTSQKIQSIIRTERLVKNSTSKTTPKRRLSFAPLSNSSTEFFSSTRLSEELYDHTSINSPMSENCDSVKSISSSCNAFTLPSPIKYDDSLFARNSIAIDIPLENSPNLELTIPKISVLPKVSSSLSEHCSDKFSSPDSTSHSSKHVADDDCPQKSPRSITPFVSPSVSVGTVRLSRRTRERSLSLSQQPRVVNINDFKIIAPISKGAYGKVYVAKKISTGDIYAIKILDKEELKMKNQIQTLKAEKEIMSEIANQFVVTMYFCFATEDKVYIVMDFLCGGDLCTLLDSLGALEIESVRQYISEAVLAVEYLHSRSIIHRDIKPDNFLIDNNGHLKLTDFGLSQKTVEERNKLFSLSSIEQHKDGENSCVGTPNYLSPEVVLGLGTSTAADWWAIGVITYELIVGFPPFQGDTIDEVFQNILARNFEWTEDIPEDAKDLINSLLQLDPTKRLGAKGASEVKAHPFFSGVDWDNVIKQQPPFVPSLGSAEDTSLFNGRYLDPTLPSLPDTQKVDEFFFVNFDALAKKTNELCTK